MITLKPWGKEKLIVREPDKYVGKILSVMAGHKLSAQSHNYKHETMYVVRGTGNLIFYSMMEDGELELSGIVNLVPGSTVSINPGQIHRLAAETDMEIFEVSTDHLGDIIRYKDDYGRV